MKVTFEFNTDSENFDYQELERYKNVDTLANTLREILELVRHWEKYDEKDRQEIPIEEISNKIWEIIKDNHLDVEKVILW